MIAPSTVAERVRIIRDAMLANEWIAGDSARALSAEWGLSERAISGYAGEASRSIRMALDTGAIRSRAYHLADEAIALAREAAVLPADRLKAASVLLGAAQALFRMAGPPSTARPQVKEEIPFGWEEGEDPIDRAIAADEALNPP